MASGSRDTGCLLRACFAGSSYPHIRPSLLTSTRKVDWDYAETRQMSNPSSSTKCITPCQRLQEEAEGITGDPVDILSQEVDVKRAHSLRCIGRGMIYIALMLAIKADRRCDIAVAVEPEQMEDALRLWSHVQKLALVWDLALCGSLRIRCVNRDVESLSAFFGSASIVNWNPKDDAGTPRCSTMA